MKKKIILGIVFLLTAALLGSCGGHTVEASEEFDEYPYDDPEQFKAYPEFDWEAAYATLEDADGNPLHREEQTNEFAGTRGIVHGLIDYISNGGSESNKVYVGIRGEGYPTNTSKYISVMAKIDKSDAKSMNIGDPITVRYSSIDSIVINARNTYFYIDDGILLSYGKK